MGPHVPSHAHSEGGAPTNLPEIHNAAVDEDAANAGGCGQVHLPTGRMCTLRHGHGGSCDFVAADLADASLARHRADETW
jgi:hypothetical protein